MSMLLSSFMFIALFAVSIAHLLWSFGRTWPIRDEKLLAQTVVGFPNIQRMPPRPASFAVSVATFTSGVFALSLADHDSGGWWLSLVGVGLGSVFLARGILGYTAWWAKQTPEPNFRLNDRRVYSPLCLFLGVGFLVLVLLRFL